jgi:multicomponent Na+:H+ antiporter subunit D
MSTDAIAPVLLALPILVAAIGRLPAVWRRPRLATAFAVGCGLVTTVLAVVLTVASLDGPLVHWVGGWEPREGTVVGIALVADGFSAGFVALAAACVTAVLWHGMGSYERTGGMFEVLTLLLLAAVTGFVLSADLFSMFVFIELLGITVYALTASKVDDPAAVPGAFNVAVTSTIGAILFLTGTAIVYGIAGTPNLAAAGEALRATGATPSAAVGVGLLVAGLATKAGVVPFHFGHLDSHTVARAPHAGLFGAVTVPVGMFGLARLQGTVVAGLADPAALRSLVLGAAVVSALLGGVLALVQQHLKRLLACSSLAHLGIVAVGVALASTDGLAAVGVYVVAHGALKLGLFLTVGVILHRLGSVLVGDLAGRAREVRVPATLLVVGAALLAGAPPGGLFVGKAGIADAAEAAGLGWVGPVLYLAATLTGVALARAAAHLWWGWPTARDPIGRIAEGSRETLDGADRLVFRAAPVVLVAAAVVAAVPAFSAAVAQVAGAMADPAVHLAAVTGGATPAGEAAVLDPWKASSLAWGLGAGVAALAGGVLLARPRAGRALWSGSGAAMGPLRRLHSGHVGDYAAWATFGAGACCAWVLVVLR